MFWISEVTTPTPECIETGKLDPRDVFEFKDSSTPYVAGVSLYDLFTEDWTGKVRLTSDDPTKVILYVYENTTLYLNSLSFTLWRTQFVTVTVFFANGTNFDLAKQVSIWVNVASKHTLAKCRWVSKKV